MRGATAESGVGSPEVLATLARFAVWAFAIIIAVNQIGVASTLVNTLFLGTVAALALAVGLAFGLGGRETAAQIVADWYRKGQQAGTNLSASADVAGRQAREQASVAAPGSGSQYDARQPHART